LRKSIAEHMRDVLIEREELGVKFNDFRTLEACLVRCTHLKPKTNILPERHAGILNALDKSPLFRKTFVQEETINGKRMVRFFMLKPASKGESAGPFD